MSEELTKIVSDIYASDSEAVVIVTQCTTRFCISSVDLGTVMGTESMKGSV